MNSHFLKVSKTHTIHYQTIGIESDPPILLLHGGPGVGCTENDLNFFYGLKVKGILIDQRGCGLSTPKGSVIENTSQDLVNDIIVLMGFLNIKKAKILGGSWGSTLAILFAIQYPERVDSLLLRGLFTATKKSWASYEDPSTHAFKKLISYVPKSYKGTVWEYYYNKLVQGNETDQKKFVRLFAEYNLQKITEGKVTTLEPDIDIHELLNINRVRLHYMVHDFFIEENYIWKHISLIKDIPIILVHGKSDEICDPLTVERFSSLLPKSSVHWVEAGHSPKEKAIIEGVRSALSILI